jgi:hypothetical protein
MLRTAGVLAPLLLLRPVFDPNNAPLLELPLLVRLLDTLFFFTPLAPDLSLHFLAPLEPPLRPRPPRKLAEPLLGARAFCFCEAEPKRFDEACETV